VVFCRVVSLEYGFELETLDGRERLGDMTVTIVTYYPESHTLMSTRVAQILGITSSLFLSGMKPKCAFSTSLAKRQTRLSLHIFLQRHSRRFSSPPKFTVGPPAVEESVLLGEIDWPTSCLDICW
jgi:hypothetical protein